MSWLLLKTKKTSKIIKSSFWISSPTSNLQSQRFWGNWKACEESNICLIASTLSRIFWTIFKEWSNSQNLSESKEKNKDPELLSLSKDLEEYRWEKSIQHKERQRWDFRGMKDNRVCSGQTSSKHSLSWKTKAWQRNRHISQHQDRQSTNFQDCNSNQDSGQREVEEEAGRTGTHTFTLQAREEWNKRGKNE